MGVAEDLEVRAVVDAGILDAAEAHARAAAAAEAGQGLLERLRGDGTITERTFSRLRARVDGDAAAPVVDQAAQTVRAWELAATVRGAHPAASAPLPGDHTPRVIARPSRSHPAVEAKWAEHTSGDFSDSSSFPVPNWDRYQPIRLLGEGGMGRVFLARDTKLDRNVAIKFVRGDDQELVKRIIAEARAQARVRDDRVCQVFDVGEIAGKVYIAMQAIEGKTLAELRHELTYEQKAMVLREAALGVNEAHKAGLIHRDLKPSNIMVERKGDGELHPFVMDFGVARDWADDNTVTGTVLGTPQFMAPEQARGEVKQLDRRADIYSLGATLYTVLVDRPPITGDNPLVVLNRISLDEPTRPRAIDPDVPADLEAIVMKCLEKERAARYDSARALADDLGRFLAGEPVAARASAGLGYRLRRTLRRRWRLVVLAVLGLAIVMVALGFGLRERWRAARREELARAFTERVEQIERLVRTSALAPAHDIRNDRALVQREMDAIAAQMRSEGAIATGAGHYALGRGHLALGDDERAEQELLAAWKSGFRDPRAAYALALAQSQLYRRGLREIQGLPSAERAKPRAELDRRYRDPALTLLRGLGSSGGVSADHVAALIAYNELRYDDALRHLDAIDLSAGGMASFYEAPWLRGLTLESRAKTRAERGEAELAATDLDAGRRALADAAAIAESDPFVQLAIADLERTAFTTEIYGGGAVDGPFDRGVAAIGRALLILPDHRDAWLLRSRFERELAVHRARRGVDVDALLTAALADARRAADLARSPREQREGAYDLADAYRSWGEVLQGQHQDPGPKLEESLKVALSVDASERDARAWHQLGLIHTHWADYQDEVRAPATDHRDEAIAMYEQATSHDGRLAAAWLNLSKALHARATRARAGEADVYLERALVALGRGAELDPDNVVTLIYQAQVRSLVADRKEARGVDPDADREAAIASYRQALRLSPDEPVLHLQMGIELAKQARAAWYRGGDPDALLAQARAAAEKSTAIAPQDPNGHNNLGDAWLQQAAFDRERGKDARPAVTAAIAAFEKALALIPEQPIILINVASAHTIAAELELDDGRDPRPRLVPARSALERSAAQEHPETEELRLRGTAFALVARWQSRRGPPADAGFAEAVNAYQRAITLTAALGPDLPDVQYLERDLAQIQLAWAQARAASRVDAKTPIADGLALADKLLAARTWPAVRAVRGGLLLVRARTATDPAAERTDAAAAAAELDAALAATPALAARWTADRDLARSLAAAP